MTRVKKFQLRSESCFLQNTKPFPSFSNKNTKKNIKKTPKKTPKRTPNKHKKNTKKHPKKHKKNHQNNTTKTQKHTKIHQKNSKTTTSEDQLRYHDRLQLSRRRPYGAPLLDFGVSGCGGPFFRLKKTQPGTTGFSLFFL